MKFTIVNILFISALLGCAQKNGKVEVIENNKTYQIIYEARRDSILEQKYFGSVYFTRDTTAKSYSYLNPKEIDSTIFQTEMRELKELIQNENNSIVKHFKNDLINTSWSSLYWFDNDFCLYSPSDWMNNTRILITDSIFYFLKSDPMLEIILSFKQLETRKYEFNSIDLLGEIKTTTIDILSPEKGIAIWEYKYKNNDNVYKELKVRSENVKLFPMIICDCGENKCVFDRTDVFSTPNYVELKKSTN